jgi:hypothetical protein
MRQASWTKPRKLRQSGRRSSSRSIYGLQAMYCARQADAQTDPKVKQQYLELKRLWLLLARSYGFTESVTDFSDETKRQADKLPKP